MRGLRLGLGEKIGKRGIAGAGLGLWGSWFLIRFFLHCYLLRSLFLVPCFVFLHISFFLSKIVLVSFVIFSGASCFTSFVLILLSSFMFTFHLLAPLMVSVIEQLCIEEAEQMTMISRSSLVLIASILPSLRLLIMASSKPSGSGGYNSDDGIAHTPVSVGDDSPTSFDPAYLNDGYDFDSDDFNEEDETVDQFKVRLASLKTFEQVEKLFDDVNEKAAEWMEKFNLAKKRYDEMKPKTEKQTKIKITVLFNGNSFPITVGTDDTMKDIRKILRKQWAGTFTSIKMIEEKSFFYKDNLMQEHSRRSVGGWGMKANDEIVLHNTPPPKKAKSKAMPKKK